MGSGKFTPAVLVMSEGNYSLSLPCVATDTSQQNSGANVGLMMHGNPVLSEVGAGILGCTQQPEQG